MPSLAENLASVAQRIAGACARSGRRAGDVTLVAVTKTATRAEAAELYRLGVRNFGENRVADGVARLAGLDRPGVVRHMIGHLQRNKAAEALRGGFRVIHGVESPRLVDALDRECGKLGVRATVLLEVNVSGEASKYGVPADALAGLAETAAAKANLDLAGLMTMAPFTDVPEETRPVFSGLRRLRDDAERRLGIRLPHLSMGMTGDFEIAVEEGATMVRIGTALFR